MNSRITTLCVATSALALTMGLSGCDREVSHTTTSKVSSDGTAKTKEEVVTQKHDGTVQREETSRRVDNSGGSRTEQTVITKSPDGTVRKEESTRTTPPVNP